MTFTVQVCITKRHHITESRSQAEMIFKSKGIWSNWHIWGQKWDRSFILYEEIKIHQEDEVSCVLEQAKIYSKMGWSFVCLQDLHFLIGMYMLCFEKECIHNGSPDGNNKR